MVHGNGPGSTIPSAARLLRASVAAHAAESWSAREAAVDAAPWKSESDYAGVVTLAWTFGPLLVPRPPRWQPNRSASWRSPRTMPARRNCA